MKKLINTTHYLYDAVESKMNIIEAFLFLIGIAFISLLAFY